MGKFSINEFALDRQRFGDSMRYSLAAIRINGILII